MTDQAETQSAAPAASTEQDLAALLSGDMSGSEQPKGHAAPAQAEAQEAVDGETPSESEAQPEVVKFKVPALEGDGDEELTAEELKAQRLMHRDYTQKTQAVAEARKEIEAERSKVQQVISEKAQMMEQNLAILGQAIQSFDQQVNWDALREVDPAAYLEARETQQARQRAFMQSAQQLEAVRADQARQMQAINAQRLVEAIPTWLDQSVAQKEANEKLK
jgi:hypothetical protein